MSNFIDGLTSPIGLREHLEVTMFREAKFNIIEYSCNFRKLQKTYGSFVNPRCVFHRRFSTSTSHNDQAQATDGLLVMQEPKHVVARVQPRVLHDFVHSLSQIQIRQIYTTACKTPEPHTDSASFQKPAPSLPQL